MSEMTATRIGWGRWWRLATLAAAAGLWFLAASFLWRSRVPSGLDLPKLHAHGFFSARFLSRAAGYDRFLRWDFVLNELALLAALAVFATKARSFLRESAAGRIGTGMLLGMLAFCVVWLAQLPFGLAELWWERRHGRSKFAYLEYVLVNFLGLGVKFLFVCAAILIVMVLATLLGRRWWIVGAPAFVGIAILFAFLSPWLLPEGTHRLRNSTVAADARRIAKIEGLAGTPVLVENVHKETSDANAFSAGIASSRRVVLWDTLLDGRFSEGEIRVVLAHEFGHLARSHIWKGLAWYALFLIPASYVVTRAVRRRGGLTEPIAIPLALFVLTLLNVVALPLQNVVSRHMEAEADWIALNTTHDPASVKKLFEDFGTSSLQEPSPPTWDYVLLEDHPTLIQRIAMVEAWQASQARQRRQAIPEPGFAGREGSPARDARRAASQAGS